MIRTPLLAALVLVFTGCAHQPGGHFMKEDKDTYSFFVGAAIPRVDWSFRGGAYFVCKNNHQTGFIVEERGRSGPYGSLEATVRCKGPVDPESAERFRDVAFQTEASSLWFRNGTHFKLQTPDGGVQQ